MSSMIDKCLQAIRPEIRQLSAYHVADAKGMVKLDAMENPYLLDKDLRAELQGLLASADLNRYPDPSAGVLRQHLREVMRVPQGSEIVLGNGSDELIQMLAMAVAQEDACLLSFEPGFVMYQMIARFCDIEYAGVPLTESFEIDMGQTRRAIEKHQPAVIFIAYPNNPSANCFNDRQIEEIIAMAPGMVVVDEAYHPFAQKSFMHRLKDHDNLLVMRTVSKLGLAGLRLGLLCGHPKLINEIDKVRLPYNINVLTQTAAGFMLEHIAVLDEQAAHIREQRGLMMDALRSMQVLEVFPSDANFILFRVLGIDANEVFERIRQQGVLIKNMKATEGLLNNCLRVTVGTPEENQAFLSALRNAVKSLSPHGAGGDEK